MKWLLAGNNESSLLLLLTVLSIFVTLLSAFGSILLLPPTAWKRFLLALLILLAMGETFLVGLGINIRLAKAAATQNTGKSPPRVVPTPKPSPKQLEHKADTKQDQALAIDVPFSMNSRSQPSIRSQFCIDSEVSGTVDTYGSQVIVKITTADFALCKYSSDNQRQVEYRVGIGARNDIRRKNWKAVSWSQPQKGVVTAGGDSDLVPPASLAIPIRRKNKATIELPNYGIVLAVYNRDRRGLYYLTNEDE